ncbi:MAG: AI-2E family transporter [Reichenbachiella sp.]
MKKSQNLLLANTYYWMFTLGFVIVFLLYFQNFLKSLIIALVIWYIIKKLRDTVALIKIGSFKLSGWLITTISTTVVFLVLYLIISILASNFQKLAMEIPHYSENVKINLQKLESQFGVDDLDEGFTGILNKYRSVIIGFAGSFAGVIGKSALIVIYIIFMLVEENLFKRKISKVLKASKNGDSISKVGDAVAHLFDRYLSAKFFTSFLTGLLSYFGLLILGIELPALWAFLIFLFNFIPSIGSVIATAFPAIFAFIQFGTVTDPVKVLAVIGGIQLFVGNIVEPRLMGDRLNISPMVIILGLTLWGFIWGVTGMLLSVPITATMIIVLGQFENSRPIAILLSKNGEISMLQKIEEKETILKEEAP